MPEKIDTDGVIDIVGRVGEKLLEQFGKIEAGKKNGPPPQNIVTQLDLQIEDLMEQELKKLAPSIGFIGEEGGLHRNAEQMWLVDPIDGTAHFIRGIPFCTTMLALIDKDEAVFSLIYDFVRKDMYLAEKNQGARLNGKPIHVSNRPLSEAFLSFESKLESSDSLESFLHLRKCCVLLNTINTGFEYALIATGKLEGRICFNPYGEDWDYAPGSLLVEEAGGIVRNIGEDTYDYHNHNFIAANRIVYEELTRGNDAIFPNSAGLD